MDYNLKNYQILKTKNYFKKNNFFFVVQSSKINLKEEIQLEQKIKTLKLKHYKILNGITLKLIKYSIYKRYYKLIGGLISLIKPKFKSTEIRIDKLKKELKFLLLIVKLNNKIYPESQISNIRTFSFKQNVFNFYKVLEKTTKISYILKNSK